MYVNIYFSLFVYICPEKPTQMTQITITKCRTEIDFFALQSHTCIHFVVAVLGSDHQFLLNLKKGLAKSVRIEEKTVKFDDVSILHAFHDDVSVLHAFHFKKIRV